jgi:oligopeptide/dipeptide ABC transporter ATP-binding protein
MKTVLKIDELCVSFPQYSKQIEVVRGCSLEVKRGQIVGLVGESGSGKSMTALSCLGLVPKPGQARGNIKINGEQIVGMADRQIKNLRGSKVAMIFQNPMTALNPFIRLGIQMADAIRANLPVSRQQASNAALAALQSVHIPNPAQTLRKYPHELSGGQLQRVMIAMAIACKPDLLIADEPTTALDVTIQAQVLLLIRELTLKNNLSVLFITHDLAVVASLCDAVSVMYAGEIVESGTVTEVFGHPAHPYTRKLLHTVPAIGRRNEILEYIPGQVPDMAALPSGCTFAARCDMALERCRVDPPELNTLFDSHAAACHLSVVERPHG